MRYLVVTKTYTDSYEKGDCPVVTTGKLSFVPNVSGNFFTPLASVQKQDLVRTYSEPGEAKVRWTHLMKPKSEVQPV